MSEIMIRVYTDESGAGLSFETYPLNETDRPYVLVDDPEVISRVQEYAQYGYIVDGQIVIPTDAQIAAIEAQAEFDRTKTALMSTAQRYLDTTAQTRNYDGIVSLCTYATSTHAQFAAEGQAGVAWRDAVWSTCYQLLDEVIAGTRPIPTEEELIGLLPVIQWPDP